MTIVIVVFIAAAVLGIYLGLKREVQKHRRRNAAWAEVDRRRSDQADRRQATRRAGQIRSPSRSA